MSGNGTTVVLGWDGLDYDLATEFGLAEAFGPYHARIDTFDNPVLGTPHTSELWPSIITGRPPEDRRIWAASEESGVEWSNPVIDLASNVAQGVIPADLREQIGLLIRDAGATVTQNSPDYYRERGVRTVFDGRASRAIAIPNYHQEINDRLGLVTDRGADLADFLTIEQEDGKTIHRPSVPLAEYEERLVGEAGKKLGLVRAALEREYDLVFVWLGYLDSVGHISPVVADEGRGWQCRAYEQAAEYTTAIRDVLAEEDTLICVSDHGLREGDHTHDPFLGSTSEAVVDRVDSVLDVADGIDVVTTKSGSGGTCGVRDAFAREPAAFERGADEVRDRLEDLGYM
jgi:hypothetical protein